MIYSTCNQIRTSRVNYVSSSRCASFFSLSLSHTHTFLSLSLSLSQHTHVYTHILLFLSVSLSSLLSILVTFPTFSNTKVFKHSLYKKLFKHSSLICLSEVYFRLKAICKYEWLFLFLKRSFWKGCNAGVFNKNFYADLFSVKKL